MIPPQLLPVIRLGAILVWVLFAVIVAVLAWQQGSESAPQVGQELSLAEIKARQQREANLQKPQAVRIPDLNELIPERAEEPLRYEGSDRHRTNLAGDDRSRAGLVGADDNLIEPRNPADGSYYSGEGLAPRDGANVLPVGPQDYSPRADSGVGGVREDRRNRASEHDDRAGAIEPLEPGIGLDGQPLKKNEKSDSYNTDRVGRSAAPNTQSPAPEYRAPPKTSEPAQKAREPAPKVRERTKTDSGELPLLD